MCLTKINETRVVSKRNATKGYKVVRLFPSSLQDIKYHPYPPFDLEVDTPYPLWNRFRSKFEVSTWIKDPNTRKIRCDQEFAWYHPGYHFLASLKDAKLYMPSDCAIFKVKGAGNITIGEQNGLKTYVAEQIKLLERIE